MDNYQLDTETKLYLPPNIHGEKQVSTRASTFSIYGDSDSTYWGVSNVQERAVLSEKKIKSLSNRSAPEAIRVLLNAFPLFKEGLALYRQNINQGYTFECDEPRAKEVVENTYREMDRTLDDIIDEQVFAMLVGGGTSYEVVRRIPDDTLADLVLVDPDSLKFEEPEPNPDQVFKIYQMSPKAVDDILLHDPTDDAYRDERQAYFYRPLNKVGDSPKGKSLFLSALSAAIGKLDLDSLMPKITRNQGFPRGFLSPKIAELVNSGLTGKALINYIKDGVSKLKTQLDTASTSESVISSIGMEFIILGLMNRQNVDGATLVNDNFLYDLQVALGLPDQLLPAKRTAVLGEQSGRTQWTRWQNVLRYFRKFFSDSLEPTTQIILSENGFGYYQIPCRLAFDNTDRELQKYEAEAFNMRVEGISQAIASAMITAEQGFDLLAGKVDITDLDFENPEPPEPTRVPEPPEPPEPNEE